MKWQSRAKQVMDGTGCDRRTALSLLQKHKGNLQAACDEYLGEGRWDFNLPAIPAQGLGYDDTPFASSSGSSTNLNIEHEFSLQDLIGAIQAGESCNIVRAYLTHFRETLGSETITDHLNDPDLLGGCPGIFFVVKTGNAEMVKAWIDYAGAVDHTYRRVPVLGFVVGLCESYRTDMPMVLKTLLSLGWTVDVIPRAFYTPLHRDLPDEGPSDNELEDLKDESKSWCVPAIRERIAQALNFSFTMRYLLHLASRAERLSRANQKLAQVHKATALIGIRYFLVGQSLASSLLTERFLTYLAMPIPQPLVLLFAGPSGHGKTELARNLGRLLSLDLQNVDCTNLSSETDLFGPWSPFQGWENGSAVNNYLSCHDGQRCIIFMDEFEKTKDEVRRGLLVPFQSGEYRDRRTLNVVNCSKTIWVLATNAFDQIIHEFCDNQQGNLFTFSDSKAEQQSLRKLGRQLSRKILKESISIFGAPMTGRITEVIPFLPFSPIEQAAVADMYLADLGRELARPIDTCEEVTRYRPVGNVDLQVKRAYSVNKALAEQGYVKELGARSIINTIDREVRMPLVGSYLAARDEIREDQPAGSFVAGVDVGSGEVEVSQCAVGEEAEF